VQLGTIYPQTHIEADPGAVRAYGNAVEELGFCHILAFDHVVGANVASRPGWDKPYDLTSRFHDPFVLFSFLSALTSKLGFATGILILPQRQTALVAKQSACLDVLCGGRFRLGIGTGWNELEYEALGVPFCPSGSAAEAIGRPSETSPLERRSCDGLPGWRTGGSHSSTARRAIAPYSCSNDSEASVASTGESRTRSDWRSGCSCDLVPRETGRPKSGDGARSVRLI
jgi:hypothetical protein